MPKKSATNDFNNNGKLSASSIERPNNDWIDEMVMNTNTMSRIKERTIAEVISSVSLWRLLYTGYKENGKIKRLSLE